jgi:CRISPR/Cas system-associated exonuclease Cas4 (RecB family)
VSLISYYFTGVHIYFEGSPLKGIQVMGMLESRGLSFDEVVVVDALEGVLPQSLKYDPLLPYDIRRAFGIRNYSEWEKLFAYNFFSLIGSVKRAHILWVDNQDGTESIEKSRFIERIIFEIEKQGHRAPAIIRSSFHSELKPKETRRVEKNDSIMTKIRSMNFSASALESYFRCPLRFYFSYIVGLEERKELSLDPDTGELGNLIHRILERIYRNGFFNQESGRLNRYLEDMVEGEFNNMGFTSTSGIGKIRCWVVVEKLKDFLVYDRQRIRQNGVEFIAFEKNVTMHMDLPVTSSPVTIKGRIDRVERQGDLIRLIDYKTGSPFRTGLSDKVINFRLSNLKNLAEPDWLASLEKLQKSYKCFQLFLYTLMMHCSSDDYSRSDAAYIFLKPSDNYFKPVFGRGTRMQVIGEDEKNILMKNFRDNLSEIMEDIFHRPAFVANSRDSHYCGYCPFQVNCGNV